MKKLLLLLIIPFLSFGQGWVQMFGEEDSYENGVFVEQSSDGGYIIVGNFVYGTTYNPNIYLIKTNSEGVAEWTQILGEEGEEFAYSVQETSDGGYIIMGETNSWGVASSIYLIKTDQYGNEQWSQIFNGDIATTGYFTQETSDQGYIIFGATQIMEDSGGVAQVGYLIKTDDEGNEEWTQIFDESLLIAFGLKLDGRQTIDGGYILAGGSDDWQNGSSDIKIIKTDNEGNPEWSQNFDNSCSDAALSIKQTIDGGYIIAGITATEVDCYDELGNVIESNDCELYSCDVQDIDVVLIKSDQYGNEQWSQSFDSDELTTETDIAWSVEQTIDGGYILVMNQFLNGMMSEGGDVFLIKTDEYGSEQWSQELSETESIDVGMSVQNTNDGGYIICGYKLIPMDDADGFLADISLIKTDGEGNVTVTSIIETTTSKRKILNTIDILGREATNKKGFQLHIYDDGSVEKKYLIK